MIQDLRIEVKLLKALQGVSYKELAEYLEVKQDSFYSWLKGNYEFGREKELLLKEVITNIKE